MKNTDNGHLVLNKYYSFVLLLIEINKKSLKNNPKFKDIIELLEITEQITHKLLKAINEDSNIESNIKQ